MTGDQAEFLRRHRRGVLATVRRNGRPQLSSIVYGFDGSEVLVSTTDDRAKTRNARRDPRVSLHVTDESFGRYLVVDGTAVVSPPAEAPGDAVCQRLEEIYRTVAGEHPDWDDFRRAMVEERRVVISFAVDHAYGTV